MEIKKAFEQMKKELKKETGIDGGFTMSKRQIENRTATYLICNNFETYDQAIERNYKDIAKVQAFTTWTDKEKEKSRARSLESIKYYEAKKSRFGTKINEAIETMKLIIESNAFKKFCEAVGDVNAEIEDTNNCYYIRFNY